MTSPVVYPDGTIIYLDPPFFFYFPEPGTEGSTWYGTPAFGNAASPEHDASEGIYTAFYVHDAGGHDTLSGFGISSPQTIDLRPGEPSSMFGVPNGPPGARFSNVDIADGVTIEDAHGGTGRDIIIGNDVDNQLWGWGGNDIITGGDGDDQVMGGRGKDKLVGGLGGDFLEGGPGADTFIFTNLSDSTPSNHDTISDVGTGDKINLRGIDAKSGAGDQAFHFIGGDAFSGEQGELRYANGVLTGDVNGDGKADFKVHVYTSNHALSADDFVL